MALGMICALSAMLAGCGLNVASADLFLLKRTGPGRQLTLLVNDSGTISCNGAKPKPLPDQLLLQARTLADDLDKDAKSNLHPAAAPGSVFSYTVKLQDGTLSFPDTAAATRPELARAELFVVQAAQAACGLT
jgi:hypothetical protein